MDKYDKENRNHSIQIENNPKNINTFNPVFKPMIKVAGGCCPDCPEPAPDQCECKGTLQTDQVIADICSGCELEGSTVIFDPNDPINTRIGQVTDVACIDGVLNATGTGVDPENNEFVFTLTLIESPGELDFFIFTAFTPSTDNILIFGSQVPDDQLTVTLCGENGASSMITNREENSSQKLKVTGTIMGEGIEFEK
jgi:hypothetical protein